MAGTAFEFSDHNVFHTPRGNTLIKCALNRKKSQCQKQWKTNHSQVSPTRDVTQTRCWKAM